MSSTRCEYTSISRFTNSTREWLIGFRQAELTTHTLLLSTVLAIVLSCQCSWISTQNQPSLQDFSLINALIEKERPSLQHCCQSLSQKRNSSLRFDTTIFILAFRNWIEKGTCIPSLSASTMDLITIRPLGCDFSSFGVAIWRGKKSFAMFQLSLVRHLSNDISCYVRTNISLCSKYI